jgi:hypothetical protein
MWQVLVFAAFNAIHFTVCLLQGLEWLLCTAGKTAAAAAAPEPATVQWLACIPDLPLQCAKAAVSLGVLPTYQQLVAAARSGAQGLQVWVDAAVFCAPLPEGQISIEQQSTVYAARLQSYLSSTQWPDLAQVLFKLAFFASLYGSEQQWQQQRQQQRLLLEEKPTPAALHDVLLVALSAGCSGASPGGCEPVAHVAFLLISEDVQYSICPYVNLPALTAASAELRQHLQHVLRQLQPEAQQQLLELALIRGHVAFVGALQKHLGWQVPEAAVMATMQHHVAAGDHRATKRLALSRAARQITAQHLAELMHAAVQQWQHRVLDTLFCTAAASTLNRQQLDQLLDAVCESQSAAVLTVLADRCQRAGLLPSTGTWEHMKWLLAAVQLDNPQALETLSGTWYCTLDTATLSALFWQAVQLKRTAMSALLLVYAAKRPCYEQQQQRLTWPDAFSVWAYVNLAMEQGCSSIRSVCRSQHCQQVLPAAAVCGFLERAIESSSSSDTISALCMLGDAQQLQPDQAVALLLQALQCDNTTAVRLISRRLLAAQDLATADNLQELLQAAAVRGLLRVSAARSWFSAVRNQLRQLPEEVLEHAVQLALITSGAGSTVFQGLLSFLQGTVQWLVSSGRCNKKELKQWEADAVARLLATAVQNGDQEAVCMLCKVPAAKRIAQDPVVQLLHSVLTQQHWQRSLPCPVLQQQQEQMQEQQQQQEQMQEQQQQQPPWHLQLEALHAMLELPGVSRLPTAPRVVSELLQRAVAVGAAQQVVEVLVRELRAVDCLGAAAVAELLGVSSARVLLPA